MQILIHPGQRQRRLYPSAPWDGLPSLSHPHASIGGEFAVSASGEADIDQLGGMPPKQSAMGERHTLPAGTRNSVTSVIRSSLGPSARSGACPLVAQQARGRLGDLALVGAVAPLLLGGAGDQALVPHDTANGPLAGACHGGDAPVAVCAAAGPERLDDRLPRCGAAPVKAWRRYSQVWRSKA